MLDFLPYLILNFQLLYLVTLFSAILRISLLHLLESFSGNDELIQWKIQSSKRNWLAEIHSCLTADLSGLGSESFCGFWAQRSKKKICSRFVHQLATFETSLRYWHKNNCLHAPHKFNSTPVSTSLSCNSAGTSPTQHLPLQCWKKMVCWDKKLQNSAALHGPAHRENCSHKWAAVLGKDFANTEHNRVRQFQLYF